MEPTFFPHRHFFISRPGCFLALSAAGHGGGPRVHTAQVLAPAEPRDTCSGRSKPRNLASNRGGAFRRDRAKQDNGNPDTQK